MIVLADRVQNILPSATMVTSLIAAEYKRNKETFYHFGLGETDGPLWHDLIEMGKKALDQGHTKYTPTGGAMDVKDGICEFFSYFGLNYQRENVMGSSGSKPILYEIMLALINPGDEVLIPVPYWVSYPSMVELVGGVPVMIRPEADNKITPEALAAAITPKTKLFIFNNPSNPSGAFYSKEEILELAAVLRKHPGITIVTDDMYWSFVYSEKQYYSFAAAAKDLTDVTLTTNGFAKSHRMTGLRWGVVGGPAHVITALEDKIQSNILGNPNTVTQRMALLASLNLTKDTKRLKEQSDLFRKRRDIMLRALRAMDLPSLTPDGTFYILSDASKYIGMTTRAGVHISDDTVLADCLAREAKVITVAGSAFGMKDCLRFAYPVDIDETIIPGMNATKRWLLTLER